MKKPPEFDFSSRESIRNSSVLVQVDCPIITLMQQVEEGTRTVIVWGRAYTNEKELTFK